MAPRPISVVVQLGVIQPFGFAIMVPPTRTVDYGQSSKVGSYYQEYGYYMSLLMQRNGDAEINMDDLFWNMQIYVLHYIAG